MRAVLEHTEQITENIRTFWFKPHASVRYIAGQFTEIRLPHANTDDRGDKRWFTLSSSPTEELLAISTRYTSESGSSFKNALFNLRTGYELNLASPMGDFVLPKDPTIPLIFVAGGIGCTPFRSITKYIIDTGEKRDITLLYGANNLEEVAFNDVFSVLGKKFIPVPTNPPSGWSGPTGKLSAEKIIELSRPNNRHYIYVSGPEPMVEKLTNDLKGLGINNNHIHTDFFPGYTEV
jgi:glycine betaine catabolism B